MSQKIEFFVATSVRMANPTALSLLLSLDGACLPRPLNLDGLLMFSVKEVVYSP
jgi:hypothetical protein